MSADNTTPPTPASWPVLTMAERRVLGVMVEKAKTTPDVYPMSLNSLMTGSNQKSNRDPIMNLSDSIRFIGQTCYRRCYCGSLSTCISLLLAWPPQYMGRFGIAACSLMAC